jgi:hypothetical protein
MQNNPRYSQQLRHCQEEQSDGDIFGEVAMNPYPTLQIGYVTAAYHNLVLTASPDEIPGKQHEQ